ncbi:hypothetical protein Leryth_001431 [Lithospermum erythrorhizon]|nr:hypothetical protein Leryth_001431 [Lithospermum erythrorhizon]
MSAGLDFFLTPAIQNWFMNNLFADGQWPSPLVLLHASSAGFLLKDKNWFMNNLFADGQWPSPLVLLHASAGFLRAQRVKVLKACAKMSQNQEWKGPTQEESPSKNWCMPLNATSTRMITWSFL